MHLLRSAGSLDMTVNTITGFGTILEEGKAKVKTTTREKEAERSDQGQRGADIQEGQDGEAPEG